MASITDFKRLFDRYQEDGAKQGISIAPPTLLRPIWHYNRTLKC